MKEKQILEDLVIELNKKKEKYLEEAKEILTEYDLEWEEDYENIYDYTPPFEDTEELLDFKIVISAFNTVCDILDFIKAYDTTEEETL